MSLERQMVKETPYEEHLSKDWLLNILHTIPDYSENDPMRPEWRPTPVRAVHESKRDLLIYVKDESDVQSNRTKTFKNRGIHEIRMLYKPFALFHLDRMEKRTLNDNAEDVPIPRFISLSSGNLAEGLAIQFAEFDLPPPKILMDMRTPEPVIGHLKGLRLDLYLADLSRKELTPAEIRAYMNAQDSIDITSAMSLEPWSVFYDWLTRNECFNERPDNIYIPYGSGRLYENFLYHQMKVITDAMKHRYDPRVRISLDDLAAINLFGAEPEEGDSKASMLTKAFNPFVLYNSLDIAAQKKLGMTGKRSAVLRVPERYISEAYAFLKEQGFDTSPDGAAATALCFYRFDKADPLAQEQLRREKHLSINSGEGIVERLFG